VLQQQCIYDFDQTSQSQIEIKVLETMESIAWTLTNKHTDIIPGQTLRAVTVIFIIFALVWCESFWRPDLLLGKGTKAQSPRLKK
jgi:hypothetical protein